MATVKPKIETRLVSDGSRAVLAEALQLDREHQLKAMQEVLQEQFLRPYLIKDDPQYLDFARRCQAAPAEVPMCPQQRYFNNLKLAFECVWEAMNTVRGRLVALQTNAAALSKACPRHFEQNGWNAVVAAMSDYRLERAALGKVLGLEFLSVQKWVAVASGLILESGTWHHNIYHRAISPPPKGPTGPWTYRYNRR
jgi:hypothetical protein